jgi:uncharacterized membrane protein
MWRFQPAANPPVLFCAKDAGERGYSVSGALPAPLSSPAKMTPSAPTRLAYIDWLRGLACLLMFQTHCYDAWLNANARKSTFFMWSQLGGTLPAPLFLFLAGISVALVADKLRRKGSSGAQVARATIRRGAEILALAILFRLQEYLIAWGWAPWSDLLRVDILNEIGVSMMLMGLACWIFSSYYRGPHLKLVIGATSAAIALTISLLSPLLWTSWRPDWLPWPIESYINGVHNLRQPQAWLFPVFPWSAFAFVGLATGFLLSSDWAAKLGTRVFVLAGTSGVALIFVGHWLEAQPHSLYVADDFWHTSPNFFLIRVGFLLAILAVAYDWCQRGAGQWGFSPLIQLGKTSLLVYWVHLEFVYGRLSILPKRAAGIPAASLGLLIISLAMLLLSMLRTRFKSGSRVQTWIQKPVGAN